MRRCLSSARVFARFCEPSWPIADCAHVIQNKFDRIQPIRRAKPENYAVIVECPINCGEINAAPVFRQPHSNHGFPPIIYPDSSFSDVRSCPNVIKTLTKTLVIHGYPCGSNLVVTRLGNPNGTRCTPTWPV